MITFKKLLPVLFSAAVLLCLTAVCANASSAAGIRAKLSELTEVYSEGTYFTDDGEPCLSASDERCNILNIPSRGGLPSGAEVAECEGQGYSYSCRAFANYVWYYIFGCHYTNPDNAFSDASPSLGDFVKFNGERHSAIYLWEDSNYYYVYDSNGDSACGVHFENRFNKEKWTLSSVSHAYNYDEVTDSVKPSFSRPDTGSYKLLNVFTGNVISDSLALCDEKDVNREAETLQLEQRWTGFTIASADAPSVFLTLNADGTVSGGKKINESSLWQLFVIGDKFFIHNVADPTVVLYDGGGELKAGEYTGKACEIWAVDHLNHSYLPEIITPATCTEGGVTKYTCACGNEYFEYTVATGHDFKQTAIVKATTYSCGFTKKVCANCGLIVREKLTGKLGKDPVCTDNVKTTGSFVLVNPCVTEEQLGDLFPDYKSENTESLKMTGAKIRSSLYDSSFIIVVAGDVNGNGHADIVDARDTLRDAIGLEKMTEYGIIAADWDVSGDLSVLDARQELRLAIGLEKAESLFEIIYENKK